MTANSYQQFQVVGMAIDPIHVGTGGARLGRVDLTIVRDPVTRVPNIPGSSLGGVYRSYAAMHLQEVNSNRQVNGQTKPYFPDCAGLGQPDVQNQSGHCGKPDCPICVSFGFARGQGGGFAGLAAFSDAQVLLFPVATREGPMWVTSPGAMRIAGNGLGNNAPTINDNRVHRKNGQGRSLNLGWLMLEGTDLSDNSIETELKKLGIPGYIRDRVALVSDKLFSHVVNSNLEVRTAVSIDPNTGAAEEGALFSYEALPRAAVLVWRVTCRNPKHFKIGGNGVTAKIYGSTIDSPENVFKVVEIAHPYLQHLGIGGMGTRGMGRLRVLYPSDAPSNTSKAQATSAADAGTQQPPAQSKQEAR